MANFDDKIVLLEIGRNIKIKRKELSWSQEDLAIATGIGSPRISEIENGLRDLQINTFLKIIWALEAAPNEIIPFTKKDKK